MSVMALKQVFDAQIMGPVKQVLIALAWHADEHGVAFPKIKTLACDLGMSPRAIERNLKTATDRGFLTREANVLPHRGRTSDIYQLKFGAISAARDRQIAGGGPAKMTGGSRQIVSTPPDKMSPPPCQDGGDIDSPVDNPPYKPSHMMRAVCGAPGNEFFESFDGALALCDLIEQHGFRITATDDPTDTKLAWDQSEAERVTFGWSMAMKIDEVLSYYYDGRDLVIDDILSVADRRYVTLDGQFVALTEKWFYQIFWVRCCFDDVQADLHLRDPEDVPGYGSATPDGANGNPDYKAYLKRRSDRKEPYYDEMKLAA